jgi:hypothetical protein
VIADISGYTRFLAGIELDHAQDIIADVKCWVRDLEQAWEKENDRRRIEVTRDQAASVLEFDIAAPRPTVWEHFTLPCLRPKWRGAARCAKQWKAGRLHAH